MSPPCASIQLQFVATRGIEAGLIQAFSRGWPSHVDAVLPDGQLLGARSETLCGVPPGVQVRPNDYEVWPRRQRVTLDTTSEIAETFYQWLHDQVGKPYDLLAIAAFPVERNWRTPGSWFCSELIVAGLEMARWFPGQVDTPSNEVTPRDALMMVWPWSREARAQVQRTLI